MSTAVMSAAARPLAGPGVLARAGDLLLVCGDGPGSERMLELFEEVVGSDGDGGVLVRRVAALLANDFDGQLPACAAAGSVPDGRLAVLVYRTASAEIDTEEGTTTLTGTDAVTSVNRLVGGAVTGLRLWLPGAGAADPRLRLGDGVVLAAGIALGTGGSTVEESARPAKPATWPPLVAPVPAPPEAAPAEPVAEEVAPPVHDVWPAEAVAPPAQAPEESAEPPEQAPEESAEPPEQAPEESAEPYAVETPAVPEQPSAPAAEAVPWPSPPPAEPYAAGDDHTPPDPAPAVTEAEPEMPFAVASLTPAAGAADGLPMRVPAADARSEVVGVRCENGHLNDPRRAACADCGLPLEHAIQDVGPRPSLGLLVLDDGSAYTLEADYILGREPQNDPDVLGGSARPLRIADADGIVSRRHIRVALADWDVLVIDLGSANGTSIEVPGDPNPRALAPHQPVVIGSGTVVTMGRRWLRFEANGQP